MAKTKPQKRANREARVKSQALFIGAAIIALVTIFLAGGYWIIQAQNARPQEAPEAQKVLDLQEHMPFQILIPAYLPKNFQREKVDIQVNQSGPGGEPMVTLTYRTRSGEALFIKEWVPVHPELETLASSRPIETKWGKGWLLRSGDEGLIALWVDIGPLRASIYMGNQEVVDTQNLLAIAENLGPASNRQVFSFVVNPSTVREVAPPPPVEIPINANGVQEVDLIVTPGGYSPLRFAIKKGVPVKLTFRQLGEVGCGNELNFPLDGTNMASLQLESPSDKKVLEFTPTQAGEFQFFCGHLMYRGIVTIRE